MPVSVHGAALHILVPISSCFVEKQSELESLKQGTFGGLVPKSSSPDENAENTVEGRTAYKMGALSAEPSSIVQIAAGIARKVKEPLENEISKN